MEPKPDKNLASSTGGIGRIVKPTGNFKPAEISESLKRALKELEAADQPPAAPPASSAAISTTAPQKPHKRRPFVYLAVVLAAAGAAAVYFLLFNAADSPKRLFDRAVANALITKSYTESSSDEAGSQFNKHSYEEAKNPRHRLAYKDNEGQVVDHYGSLKNSYVRTSAPESSELTEAEAKFNTKWIQIRKDGKLPPFEAEELMGIQASDNAADPIWMLTGKLIFGDFNDSERQALTATIAKHNVYRYDEAKVTTETKDGRNLRRYDVSLDVAGLKELNKQVAKTYGLNDKEIEQSLAELEGTGSSLRLYIDPATKMFVRLESGVANDTSAVIFKDFNRTTVEAEPKADFSYEIYAKEVLDMTTQIDAQRLAVDPAARDAERKNDLRAIQTKLFEYYALYGRFPLSLAVKELGLKDSQCRGPNSQATCRQPDYTYKVFTSATDINAFSTFKSAEAAYSNGTAKDAENFIVYTNSMETARATFYQLTSNE